MTAFLEAAGGREPLRFLVGGEPVSVAAPVVLAARRGEIETSDGFLAFILVEGRLFAFPLSHGVLRNDELARPGWVGLGDQFTVGGTVIEPLNPKHRGHGPDDFDPLASNGETLSDLHFEPLPPFKSKKGPQRLAVLPRITLAGRHDPAKFKINHDGIEPVHALIVRTNLGPWLVDLTLRGRTTVNDNVVTQARLKQGDRVSLGGIGLVAHVTGDAVAPVPNLNDSAVAPILAQVAQFQQQTFEQFREMLGTMQAMFGTSLSEHRELIKDTMVRVEKVEPLPAPLPALPEAPRPPVVPTPIPQPAPGYSAPPANVELHTWVHEQLGNLERQESRWKRLLSKFRKNSQPG